MNFNSIFDVIGPVMIGPSSSHTAGAAKIGYLSTQIFDKQITAVEFYLHGSFAKTYKGHGTDRALLAGIMRIKPDDSKLRKAFEIVQERGIEYNFYKEDLGDVHPNSVRIVLFGIDDTSEQIIGSSVGGGRILISRIGQTDVEVDGDYATLITKHFDKPGVIAKVSTILSAYGINIAFMKVFRQLRGAQASLIVQVDEILKEEILNKIQELDEIQEVKFINSLRQAGVI
ncbi:MAG: L-serine ammonia-lyase, iron-sulfur-dependent subunit beta [Clostridiales bacterium]|nr:L-serine ammonia-lyase, iron-sulfur-dependent subunit beta [Clostridiales bacterium]